MRRSLKKPGVKETNPLALAKCDDIPDAASEASVESMPSENIDVDLDNLCKNVRSNVYDSSKYEFSVTELEDPQTLTELEERLESLSRFPAEKLQREYESLGYVADDLMARGDLQKKVQRAEIRRHLGPLALQKECVKQGLEIDDGEEKDDLLRLLQEHTWESFDIPVSRLPSTEVARKVLELVRRCENQPTSELELKCTRAEIPLGGMKKRATPEQLLALLRQHFIWKAMPLKELQRDCQARSLSPTVDTRLSEDEAKKELSDRLTASLRSVTLQMRGIPVDRLGAPEVAQELLAKVDRLQNMGMLSLKSECYRMNVTYKPYMQNQAVVDRLRDVLVWKHLPLEELQQECQKHGVLYFVDGDDRNKIINDLLEVRDHQVELEELGLPAKYLEDNDLVSSISERFKDVETMSTEDLVEWYESIPFPASQCMPRKDLEFISKKVIVWELLDFVDLQEKCSKAGVPVAGITTSDDERQQLQQSLITCLGLHQCIESLSTEGLQEWYSTMGLPSLEGVERPAIQQFLRNYHLTWENLSFAELQDQCSERQIKSPGKSIALENDEEQRHALVEKLIRYDCIEIMGLESLRELYNDFIDLPGSASLKRQDLKLLLHKIYEWLALPLPELRAECTKLEAPTAGTTLSEERQQQLLICKLAFRESIEYLDTDELLQLYEGPFPEGIKKKDLRELLQKTLAWEALPLEELRRQYDQVQGTSSEAAPPREEGEQQEDEQRQLINKLILHERIECMSLDDLSRQYEDLNLPLEEGMTRSDLQGFFKRLWSWRSMSLLQLREECASQGLSIDGADTFGDEDEQRELLGLLVEHDRTEAWEAKNFKAKRIDNFCTVSNVVRLYAEKERLDARKLKEEYVEIGFPDQIGMDRASLLEALKEWLIWHALPFPELMKDCEEQGLPVPPDCCADDQLELVQLLVMNKKSKAQLEGRLVGRAKVPKALTSQRSAQLPEGDSRKAPRASVPSQVEDPGPAAARVAVDDRSAVPKEAAAVPSKPQQGEAECKAVHAKKTTPSRVNRSAGSRALPPANVSAGSRPPRDAADGGLAAAEVTNPQSHLTDLHPRLCNGLCLFINLDRRDDRRKRMERLAAPHPWLSKELTRISARDGNGLDWKELVQDRLFTRQAQATAQRAIREKRPTISAPLKFSSHLTLGGCGCALSHQMAWRTLVESERTWALILEDDLTQVCDDFDNALESVFELLPDGWNMCYLGFHTGTLIRRGTRFIGPLRELGTKDGWLPGLWAYLISKHCARKMLLQLFPMNQQVDTEVGQYVLNQRGCFAVPEQEFLFFSPPSEDSKDTNVQTFPEDMR